MMIQTLILRLTWASNIPARRSNPGGYTLVELVVSLATASILTIGLASSLYVSNRTLDGSEYASTRNKAADIQNDMCVDLNLATGFDTTAPDLVSFTVPDRNNDAIPETIAYSWTGLPDAKLQYSFNGSQPVTLLDNVQDCDFAYQLRTIAGGAATTLTLPNPLLWGMRWSSGSGVIGYEDVFANALEERRVQIATKVQLTEAGTVQSITAYLQSTKSQKFCFAIYSHNALFDRPIALLAQTAIEKAPASGWMTLTIAPTSLTPGTYWLALSYEDNQTSHREESGGTSHRYDFRATQWGFAPLWGLPSTSSATRVSIYANYVPN